MKIKRLKLAADYLLKKSRTVSYPSHIGIETTNNCNLDCIMCPRHDMTRPVQDMDMQVFRKIINDIKGEVEMVWLQHYGEPFLDKKIFEKIKYAKTNGLQTGISSNGTALSSSVIEDIFESGHDYIIFAFDGASKETYEKIRLGANFEHVTSNIKKFLEMKIKNKINIFTVLQLICMSETEDEIQDFISQWDIDGVDGIRIRQVTHSGNNGKFNNQSKKQPCYWLWSDPHIQVDGTVVPCCQDVNAVYPIGNINEQSLGEIWNSKKMIKLREKHIDGDLEDISLCQNCNMYQPHPALVIGNSILDYAQASRLVPKAETIISKLRY